MSTSICFQPKHDLVAVREVVFEGDKGSFVDITGEEHSIMLDQKDRSLPLLLYDRRLSLVKVPENVKNLEIHNNYLKDLDLPEGVETVKCYNNMIKRLRIPKSLRLLECDGIEFIGDISKCYIEIVCQE